MELGWIERLPRPVQHLVCAAASVHQSIRHRTPMRIAVDADGDWMNQQRDMTLFSPVVHAAPSESVRRNALDLWCHMYDPRPGDMIVDVGAGIGAEAILLSRLVGPSGRVLAIEAHPRTYGCLEKSLRASEAHFVTSLRAAVTREHGAVELSDDAVHNANAIVRGRVDGRRTVSVHGRPLDEIALLKMNIEGAEVDALGGATSSLARTRNVVISCHDFIADGGGPESTRTFPLVEALLRKRGFALTVRDDDPRPWVRCTIYGEAS